ncbi:uncharacterized protein [Misgurnus anguillicaudatus]|uniref:uncharacterized protein isoform X2 n=1 Tax=Misgurnus anguillicaudatus TaxID=75329 RepID=UPI003CCF8DD3
MYPAGIFFHLFGFVMVKFITCYSDGTLLDTECQGMNVNHGAAAQTTESPFTVTPEQRTFIDSEVGHDFDVTLSGTAGNTFMGFMLEARKCETCPPAGTFGLTDPSKTVLLTCDGQNGRAVSHADNLDKNNIAVKWRCPEAGTFFFRAAITKTYDVFWLRKSIILTTAAPRTTPAAKNITIKSTAIPTATTTKVITTVTAPRTTLTTKNISANTTKVFPTVTAPRTTLTTKNISANTTTVITTVTPTPPPTCLKYVICVLALLLLSRLCFLGGSSFLVIIRPVFKLVIITGSFFELAFKFIAVVLVVIRAKTCDGLEITFTALTVTAMVLSLLHTITISIYREPSQTKLRKCWLCAVMVVDLLNTSITSAAIFVGLWCFQGRWLTILMGVYVIWEILFYLTSFSCDQLEKCQIKRNLRGLQNQGRKICRWIIFFVYSLLNIFFTIALIIGVCLTRMVKCL